MLIPRQSLVLRAFFLLWVWLSVEVCSSASDPYKVLGVSRRCSQEEIRRNYRRLCLKYHPDKNVNKSPKERRRCEDRFKDVQTAYSKIGNEESRSKYDQTAAYSSTGEYPSTSSYRSSSGATMGVDDFYRAFYGNANPHGHRSFFRVNGMDTSEMFSGMFAQPFKSIYVQKVEIALKDLHQGRNAVDFELKDNIWKRWRAAFRGKAALPILYEALVLSFPTMRVIGFPLALVLGTCLFHFNLPRPSVVSLSADIKSGWKGGTKLKFHDVDPGFEFVFILTEGKDRFYERKGNNLTTTIFLSKQQALDGFDGYLEPLSDLDEPIKFSLKPGQIKETGDRIVVRGKGWPRRDRSMRGDLFITFNLVSKKEAKALMKDRLRTEDANKTAKRRR